MQRKQFIEGGTREQAEALCPWAAEVIEVDGGWKAFEDAKDIEIFQGAA